MPITANAMDADTPGHAPGRRSDDRSTAPHVVLCRTATELSAIRQPGVTLALWRRTLPTGLATQLARFTNADQPSFRLATTPDEAEEDIAAAFPAAGRNSGPLLDDIARLVRLYADLVGCPGVMLRLDSVADDGCRFFHADHVGLRLLCTYQGAGTQWLPDEAANRPALGRGDNDAVIADPDRLQVFGAGHVGLLKGESWPGNRGRGLVHRSPPADHSGLPRLLLCLDHDDH
ncbi:DUF1826 domain-containing protein [Azospirillum argentinense]|uniref:DUF1826 domain-containing protein n=2 Tax=Azospirillum argentinense TaxID=2970906 RepID=UPI001FFF1BC6|nr:DUF1826 domain-containing protein [Azospirillum argentinense]